MFEVVCLGVVCLVVVCLGVVCLGVVCLGVVCFGRGGGERRGGWWCGGGEVEKEKCYLLSLQSAKNWSSSTIVGCAIRACLPQIRSKALR